MTPRELQTLRNMGNEAEQAAAEIERLRAEIVRLHGGPAPVHAPVDEIRGLLSDGKGIEDIARHFRCSPKTIRTRLKAAGIPTPTAAARKVRGIGPRPRQAEPPRDTGPRTVWRWPL